ncbi:MAG: hypothetical protein ILP19_04650, partial [Oscillospiraceae bacterium]|nr:hypothetical protein [Oscillospiraceae bacterium]
PSLTYEDSGYEYYNATELGRKLVLTVDGPEYKPHLGDNSTALPWCDKDGVTERGVADAWYVCYNFDAIDFEHAKEVKLRCGFKSYVLKGDAGSSKIETTSVSSVSEVRTISSDKFDLTLVGVSGSKDSPIINIDLKVKDSQINSKYDGFMIMGSGRTLAKDMNSFDRREYNNANFGSSERDTADPTLYHISVLGSTEWMLDDQMTVFDIRSITAYSDSMMTSSGITKNDLIDNMSSVHPQKNIKQNGADVYEIYTINDRFSFKAADAVRSFGKSRVVDVSEHDDSIISIESLRVEGEIEQPRLLLHARINDKGFTDKYDHIFIVTEVLGREVYDKGLEDNYGSSYGFAVKDAKDPALYHISVDVPPAWVANGEETILTISALKGYSGNDMRKHGVTEKDVEDYWNHAQRNAAENLYFEELDIDDITYRFIVPDNALSPAIEKRYQQTTFEKNGAAYTICSAQYGSSETRLNAYIGGIDLSQTYDDYAFEFEGAEDLAKGLVMTVDGKEYRPHSTSVPSCDKDGYGELEKPGVWYVGFNFDAINYNSAKNITLSCGSKSYTLKGTAFDRSVYDT